MCVDPQVSAQTIAGRRGLGQPRTPGPMRAKTRWQRPSRSEWPGREVEQPPSTLGLGPQQGGEAGQG